MDKNFLDTVAKILEIDPGKLKEDSTAETIEEWDSLNHWTIIGELEEVYGVEFTMDEATGFKNLGDMYNILANKLK